MSKNKNNLIKEDYSYRNSYLITYDRFSGTIETLLVLIQKKELDIYEIKLATIICDFLNYIRKINVSLDILSNFLYIACILLEIKSRSLIPSRGALINEDNEDDNTELNGEIKNILKRREDEYRIYKKASEYLESLQQKESYYLVREAPIEEGFLNLFPNFLKDINLEDLAKLASRLLGKREEKIELNYIYDNSTNLTVFEEMERIKKLLNYKEILTFKELTLDYHQIIDKIICFLSILELYKNETIDIIQFESFGNIIIKRIKEIYGY